MRTYFVTFTPGFSEVVTDTLKNNIHSIEITNIYESSLLIRTDMNYADISSLSYLNNVFLVLSFIPSISREVLNGTVVKQVYKKADISILFSLKSIFPTVKTMRIMIQKGSELIHIPKDFTKKITSSLSEQTKLTYSPESADIEFWFLIRNEGFAVMGIKHASKKTLYPDIKEGQLKPGIAHLLNLLSEPSENDNYLDPFAGNGALPINRCQHFPYKHIFLSDKDKTLTQELRRLFFNKKNITINHADALHLRYLQDKSVNKIVSDPPWGIYQMQNINYEDFYKSMLTEMVRVLKAKGLIIILTAKTNEFENALFHLRDQLELLKKYSTLINGKKASVYKIIR